MAIKYLDAKRIRGTAAERIALTALTGTTAISDTNLKAYWKFVSSATPLPNASTSDETLGTSADAIITSMTFDTTITSDVPHPNAKSFDTEGVFDGVNDKLTMGSSTSQFNFMHSSSALWTLCFWMKENFDDEGGVFNTSDSTHFAQNVGINVVNESTDGKMILNVNAGSSQGDIAHLDTGDGYIPDTGWHFYCITYNHSLSSNNFKLTRDNDNLEQATKTSATPSSGSHAQAALVGVHTASTSWFGGSLAEMSVWNRILTSSEITTLYNGGDGAAIYSSTALNLPAGTIFEQTDDYKFYMWNGINTWTVVVAN